MNNKAYESLTMSIISLIIIAFIILLSGCDEPSHAMPVFQPTTELTPQDLAQMVEIMSDEDKKIFMLSLKTETQEQLCRIHTDEAIVEIISECATDLPTITKMPIKKLIETNCFSYSYNKLERIFPSIVPIINALLPNKPQTNQPNNEEEPNQGINFAL